MRDCGAEDNITCAVGEDTAEESVSGTAAEDAHIIHLPEPFEFSVDENYDYLRAGVLKSLWYRAVRFVAHLLLNIFNRVVFGLKVEGWDELVRLGASGAVVVCNHVHVMDCTFIDCMLPLRRVYYTTLETNFRIPVARHLIRWLGGVPIPRKVHELHHFGEVMEDALRRGKLVCMYPEAVLHPYYEGVRRFHDGAFVLAARSGCPVLPMAVSFRPARGLFRLYKRKPCVTLSILPAVGSHRAETPSAVREEAERLRDICFSSIRQTVKKEK